MDDLLNKHADRIDEANSAMTAAATAIVGKANAEARSAISLFGQELIEATRSVDAALATATAALQAAIDAAQVELAGAFTDNVTALAASSNAMREEMAERTRFLATGELPIRDPLPPVEAPVRMLSDERTAARPAEELRHEDADVAA